MHKQGEVTTKGLRVYVHVCVCSATYVCLSHMHMADMGRQICVYAHGIMHMGLCIWDFHICMGQLFVPYRYVHGFHLHV